MCFSLLFLAGFFRALWILLDRNYYHSKKFYYVNDMSVTLSIFIWCNCSSDLIIVAIINWPIFVLILQIDPSHTLYWTIHNSFASVFVAFGLRCFKLVLDKIIIRMSFSLSLTSTVSFQKDQFWKSVNETITVARALSTLIRKTKSKIQKIQSK